jgi:Putative zinc-finger
MKGCEIQASGAIDLYFYDELDERERASVEEHLTACAECERALEELSTIRAALAARPQVDAPPDGDWRAFMIRLDEAVRFEKRARATASVIPMPQAARPRPALKYAQYVAAAAVVTLVISGIGYWARRDARPLPPQRAETQRAAGEPVVATPVSAPAPIAAAPERRVEAAFASLSEQHFERSKLVVLGLANKDPHHAREADWAFERGLASSLLSDTRLYRQAAEARGMKSIAGVMGDLELVLLQTSLADAPDAEALEQIQRLIHKRDLVTKMEVTATTGS